MTDQPAYAIASVDNALRVLLLLQQAEPLRVSQVAEELGVARSTAHRILSMLCYRGFAIQTEGRVYRAGPALYRFRPAGASRRDLTQAARPHLERLNLELDETVHLMVLRGSTVSFVDSIEARQALRVGSRAGATMPAHLTSGGKALLAELSTEELELLYPDGPPALSGIEARSVADFRRALQGVRRRGYGINIGESERGLTAVGACVHDPAGPAVAAVSISAPSLRLTRARIPDAAEALLRTTRLIETALATEVG